jgi:hypothetical protein
MKFREEIAQQMEDANSLTSHDDVKRFMRRRIWDVVWEQGDDEDRNAMGWLFEGLLLEHSEVKAD